MSWVYFVSVLLLSALILFAWCYRYHIKPYFAKNILNVYFKKHPEGTRLKKAENFLNHLYNSTSGTMTSYRERKRLGIDDDAFIYGEIEFLSFFTLLDLIKPKPYEVFYDLGSGAGKALFAVALYGNIEKVNGIELLPALYQLTQEKIKKASIMAQDNTKILENINKIHLINKNFPEVDFTDGNIIFINATCLSYPTWEALLKKFEQLKTGSRIIVTTKKIAHPAFQILYQGMTLMSWGINSVNIYIKL